MHIKLFFSPHCTVCSQALQTLRREPFSTKLEWQNILDNIDEAVACGIRTPPALVVDGRLLEQGAGVPSRLRQLLAMPDTDHPA